MSNVEIRYSSIDDHKSNLSSFHGPSTSQQPSTSTSVVARKKSLTKVHTDVPRNETGEIQAIRLSALSSNRQTFASSESKLNLELRRTPSSIRSSKLSQVTVLTDSESKKVEFSLAMPNGSFEVLADGTLNPNENIDSVTEESNRPAWENKLQCFLSIIGFCVGLGNIWRFPYLCQKNGGGAFLIPYMIFLILEGMPLFLIELGIGQKFRHGALGAWNLVHPWSAGIGIASCIVAISVALYYNVIIAWVMYYLYQSFVSLIFWNDLPWASCPMVGNITVEECAKSSETAYFWYRHTLDISSSIEDGDSMKTWVIISFVCSWLLVYLVVMKGINSSKYVVYFTSLFPYFILFIFLGRGLFLEGAMEGLEHMFKPRLEMLKDSRVWLDAATQVFYSFGLAFGSLIAFGSYNEPKNNCVRDVIYITICNAFTAILATTVVFAFLGYKAMNSFKNCNYENSLIAASLNETLVQCNLDDELNNVAEGTGMAFIVFAQAILELPLPQIWSIAFFLMLLSLGLGSQIGILEGALSVLTEIKWFKGFKKPYITGVMTLFCFTIGLRFCTGSGEYWVQMFDSFAGTIGLVFIAFMEMIVIGFVYGTKEFSEDIYEMTGYKPGKLWRLISAFVGPIMTAVVLGANLYDMMIDSPTYKIWNLEQGKTVTARFPNWALIVAICIVIAGVAPILLNFLVSLCMVHIKPLYNSKIAMRRNETTVSTRTMMESVDDGLDRRENGQEDMHVRRRKPDPIFPTIGVF